MEHAKRISQLTIAPGASLDEAEEAASKVYKEKLNALDQEAHLRTHKGRLEAADADVVAAERDGGGAKIQETRNKRMRIQGIVEKASIDSRAATGQVRGNDLSGMLKFFQKKK